MSNTVRMRIIEECSGNRAIFLQGIYKPEFHNDVYSIRDGCKDSESIFSRFTESILCLVAFLAR